MLLTCIYDVEFLFRMTHLDGQYWNFTGLFCHRSAACEEQGWCSSPGDFLPEEEVEATHTSQRHIHVDEK